MWVLRKVPLLGIVALRKESVDRNKYVVQCRKVLGVALRKESVDRNSISGSAINGSQRSLSARRAWIEMQCNFRSSNKRAVALRKESVDRNVDSIDYIIDYVKSLSARRAWIEMSVMLAESFSDNVALRKESVDRNVQAGLYPLSVMCRSPQGERG